jgi:hypothetical protein
MTHAIIHGTYSDLKTIKTRSVVQVIIEVPIEYGSHVINAFGFPQPGHEVQVAIARLQDTGTATTRHGGVDNPVADQGKSSDSPRTLAQMVGAACQNTAFIKWAQARYENVGPDIATFVRKWCGVTSRSEIRPGTVAATKWKQLHDQFWLESRGYV